MPDLELEKQLHDDGHIHVAGIDEAGRGPLAGPVVAGAVILPKDFDCPGLNDSKKLSAKKRDTLYEVIVNHPVTLSRRRLLEASVAAGGLALLAPMGAAAEAVRRATFGQVMGPFYPVTKPGFQSYPIRLPLAACRI